MTELLFNILTFALVSGGFAFFVYSWIDIVPFHKLLRGKKVRK